MGLDALVEDMDVNGIPTLETKAFEQCIKLSGGILKCFVCAKSFDERRGPRKELRVHLLRMHGGYKPHKCTLCQSVFAIKRDLNRHYLQAHEQKPHKCTYCEETFAITRQESLKFWTIVDFCMCMVQGCSHGFEIEGAQL